MFALSWLIFYELEHGFDPRRLITTENVPLHHRHHHLFAAHFEIQHLKTLIKFSTSRSSMVRVKKNSHSFHDAIIETFKNMRSQ